MAMFGEHTEITLMYRKFKKRNEKKKIHSILYIYNTMIFISKLKMTFYSVGEWCVSNHSIVNNKALATCICWNFFTCFNFQTYIN